MHNTECSVNTTKKKIKIKKKVTRVDKLHRLYESSYLTINIWNHKLKLLLKIIFHKRNNQEVLLQ